MKSSPLALGILAATFLLCPSAQGQDAVILTSGQERTGKIVGFSNGNVRLQVDTSTTGIPLSTVKSIRMNPPTEFDAAAKKLAAGDAPGAITALQKINDNFAGLPAPWVERSVALLGDAKLATGDKAGAQAAYDNLLKLYPTATALANLGRARLAVDAGQFDQASPLLDPLLANSAKTAFPSSTEGSTLCQAHYLQGRVYEATGNYSAALEQYLKASAVFPFDSNAAADAKVRADRLRNEHAGLIAP
jgi:tetratricopeptide (TPR) repeat protein